MKNWMKIFLKSVLCIFLAVPALTSCYDDTALWDKVKDMENRLNELEVELTSQTEALNALLTNGATLTSCKKNSDGSYTITLSNGTKFNVLPEGTDFSSLVTFKDVNGKKCWATYNANGQAVILTDKAGNAIPVSDEISVEIKDGVYCLIINGKVYETGYDAEDVVQVFSSCTPLTDASGNVYAVKFTFGEGMETTVALDGYAGGIFKISNVNNTVVSDYYVGYGMTESFLMEMTGVVDYVMQVPDGWRVKEVTEELTGETYLNVTAPAEETVALGAAVADGYIKVVSVVEGGKASVSKMYVSTDPFKTYNVSSLKAVIEPYTGIQKFAYGLMPAADFTSEGVVAEVNKILSSSSELPKGYYVSETAIEKTMAEIYGSDLIVTESYVFWTLPALYNEKSDNAGYYAVEDMLRIKVLEPVDVKLAVSDVTLFDAQLDVQVKGAESVYLGLTEVTETYMEEILYQVNNGIIDPSDDFQSYKGLASEFPNVDSAIELKDDTKYAVWIIPVTEGRETYAVSDVVVKTFTTKGLAPGGTLKVSASDITPTVSSLSSNLSCEGASMIYYAYLNESDGTRYETASNEVKMSKILAAENHVAVKSDKVEAIVKGLKPATAYWLYAVAVGKDGLYGDVTCKKHTTQDVSFNALSLSLESLGVKANSAKFKVTVDGGTATEYIYWCGYEGNDFWLNDNYCGGNRTSAQSYMAANPDADQIVEVMKRNGALAEDGTITVNELAMSTNYVFIILAKDESGKYSKAAYKKFTTLAADLGDLVAEGTDKWNEALGKIRIEWIEESFHAAENSNLSGSYSFKFSGPTDLTAFVMCASEKFFETAGLISVEEQIVYTENYASRKYDNGYVPFDENGEMMTEPDYYKNGELHGGQLMNVYDFYVHGLPSLGFATYFAKGDHDAKCIYWEDGKCSAYERALERIAYYNTLVPYKEKASQFGLKGAEADAWAEDLLEAYKPYYENAKPIIYYNEGQPLVISYPYANGKDDEGKVVDRVVVVFRDLQGNYYAPMSIEVPDYY